MDNGPPDLYPGVGYVQTMLQLVHPDSQPLDLLDLYLSDKRSITGRPWVMVNMISSIDGATAIGGRSTGLGDDDDPQVFRAIRSVPDVILVGAGTVTAEDYRPVTLDRERRERRVALGKAAVPTLAIVSGRLSIDPEARVFADPEHKPLIITGTMANPAKLAMIGDAADVAILSSLNPESILGHLGAASVVLLEGGPTLNAQFGGAGLIDEMNLTLRSAVVAGDSKRITNGADIDPIFEMTVDRVLQGDRSLFIRYLKA